jgi:hypothetical protein
MTATFIWWRFLNGQGEKRPLTMPCEPALVKS